MKIKQENFNLILNNNYIFENSPNIAVAVSGGPDSMALLFLLNKWIKTKKGKLIALIVDHKLRKNSNTEAKLIKEYLFKNNINSKIFVINKSLIKKKNMNEARNNRFFKLINFCKKNDLFHLFVAHHQDDNLETYFLRKIAGSNFEGLRSMRMNSEIQGLRILRPLLNFSKDQVLRYNKKNNIFYVNDPSNKNLSYSRIIIRKFLSDRKKLKKEVNTDFKLIQNYFPYYKKMIFQKFNLMLISINKKSITMDKKIFFIEELEIQCKIIEVIYKYLLPNKVPLRYSKIMNSIRILITPETKKINLAGMLIKKDQFSIYFRI